MNVQKDLITALVYTELDDEIGPNPIVWLPSDLSEEIRIHISIKTITLLSGEHGLIPKALVFIPFPSLNLKGAIKYVQWRDKNKRGGVGQAAITLVFNDFDDLIFYKYKNNLELSFNETTANIIKLKESNIDSGKIDTEIKNLNATVLATLGRLRVLEESNLKKEAIPSRNVQYSEFIDYKFKVIFCGEPEVGKTSLILRFSENAFTRKYIPTLGVNVSDKIFRVDGTIVQLVLWDLAGQERFKVMRQQFYQGSDGIFLIFDLTNLKSFDRIKEWHQDVQKQLKNKRKIFGFVIGNKSDLFNQRIVSKKIASQLARELKLGYLETSALTGEKVEYAFVEIAKLLLKSVKLNK